jgi:DTW domain-containing protein YfiP
MTESGTRPLLSEHRCPRCEIRKPLCFCAFIPQIHLQTQLVILMHASEQVLTTNTARLAAKALPNSEIRIRGRKDERMCSVGLKTHQTVSLVLYPSPHAVELNENFASRLVAPVTLIVPDGSWAQTRRIVRRETALRGIPHVKLPQGPASEYRLRLQPTEHRLCTFEAIARALGIIESRDAQARLETLLRVMVERTLWSRGVIAADQCTTAGIPSGAFS